MSQSPARSQRPGPGCPCSRQEKPHLRDGYRIPIYGDIIQILLVRPCVIQHVSRMFSVDREILQLKYVPRDSGIVTHEKGTFG